MRNVVYSSTRNIFMGIGSCSVCMKQAFQAAAISIIVATLASVVASAPISTFTTSVATLFVALWISHVLVYAGKNADVLARDSRGGKVGNSLRAIGKAIGISTKPNPHRMDSSCGGDGCGSCERRRWSPTGNCERCRSCGNNCGDNPC